VLRASAYGAALLILIGGHAITLGQTDGGPAPIQGKRSVVAESRFNATNASVQTRLVQLVVDFAPRAWTSLHTHGGQAINLVLEGEISLRHGSVDRPHRAGQSWTDSSTQIHAAGNTGPGKARLLTSLLLPKSAPEITVIQESSFGPEIIYEAKFDLPALPAEADIVQQVIDLSPGWHAEREAQGFVATIVVDGEVSYQIGTDRKQYRAGSAFSMQAPTRITEVNRSNTNARLFTTYLIAKTVRPP
jgi:quercetin dioxygenase-like cupin family protein